VLANSSSGSGRAHRPSAVRPKQAASFFDLFFIFCFLYSMLETIAATGATGFAASTRSHNTELSGSQGSAAAGRVVRQSVPPARVRSAPATCTVTSTRGRSDLGAGASPAFTRRPEVHYPVDRALRRWSSAPRATWSGRESGSINVRDAGADHSWPWCGRVRAGVRGVVRPRTRGRRHAWCSAAYRMGR